MKKYQLIANTIKERIIKGIYPQQSFLPKQEELAEEFSVSKITVKSALDLLEREGFVYKESGLGTKVLSNLILLGQHDSPVNSFAGLSAENGSDRVSSKIIKFEVAFPSADLCEKLNLDENDPVYEIIRLRLLDDEPLVIEHTYMPVSQVPALSKRILEGSIYSYLHKKLHIKFGGVFRRRLICQMNMTGSTLGLTKARRFWKSSRSSGPIPGSTLNILGQETSTAIGLISWSKPAIKLTKKYPLKESKSSVGISLLSYLLAL